MQKPRSRYLVRSSEGQLCPLNCCSYWVLRMSASGPKLPFVLLPIKVCFAPNADTNLSFATTICDTKFADFIDPEKPLQKGWLLQRFTRSDDTATTLLRQCQSTRCIQRPSRQLYFLEVAHGWRRVSEILLLVARESIAPPIRYQVAQ